MKKESDNTEKSVEKIFNEFKNKKLERVIKRARWQTILRNILISFLVFCVFSIAASYLINAYISRQRTASYGYIFAFNSISAPNKHTGIHVQQTAHASIRGQWSKTDYTTYKIIEGKVVYTGRIERESSPSFGNLLVHIGYPPIMDYNFSTYEIEDFGYRRYNELGQRVMVFFYPFLIYDTNQSLNDLDLLDDIGNEKYMEMALSFNREYTIEEVEKMLPESTTVTWYWVDDLSENEKEISKIPRAERLEMEPPFVDMPDVRSEYSTYIDIPVVRSEYTAYGIKLYDNCGAKLSDPVGLFIRIIEVGKTAYKREDKLDNIYNNMAGDDGKLTQDDIRIWGAVVTGDSESLKALIGLPFIEASSIGVITDKY
ncbi:MAG: anti-sigma factor [Actinomycetia bacterium]|nr:anti-sigma factor [Actinomycetes bacterium]